MKHLLTEDSAKSFLSLEDSNYKLQYNCGNQIMKKLLFGNMTCIFSKAGIISHF